MNCLIYDWKKNKIGNENKLLNCFLRRKKINCGNKFDENKFFDMRLEKLICLIYDIGGK